MSRVEHSRSRIRPVPAVLLAAASATMLSACVGKPAHEYELTAETTCPVTPSEVTGSVRLGFQVIPGPDLFIQDQGVLEACLPKVDVTWIRFPTGQDVVQGFAANSIDYGFLGSTPAAKALSAPLNLDATVPMVSFFNSSSEALVAKNATSIEELKGRKIATAFSSTSHYSLLRALEKAGLDPRRDVEITNISPDKLPAAWASDEIEAAYIWNPTLMEIQRSGNTLLDSGDLAEAGAPTLNVPMVMRTHAAANPEVLEMWVRLQNWSTDIAARDPERYIAANSAQTGMTPADTKIQLAGVRNVPAGQQPEALADAAIALSDTASFLQQQGGVTANAPEHYRDAAQPGYVERALEPQESTPAPRRAKEDS